MKRITNVCIAAVALGVLASSAAATAAVAETQYGDDSDVTVNVDIPRAPGTGTLSLTVAGTSTSLTENGSTGTVRQFTGKLPTVTVTDTRDVADVPDGAFWYVLGSATDFVSAGGDVITADHLGWSPMLTGSTDPGSVSAGDPVDTVLDGGPNGVGLVDRELLAMASDSAEINPEGQWSVSADLFLRTPATVNTGSYSSTLTLSLFE
jgi:opacity protein-like surface antigen